MVAGTRVEDEVGSWELRKGKTLNRPGESKTRGIMCAFYYTPLQPAAAASSSSSSP